MLLDRYRNIFEIFKKKELNKNNDLQLFNLSLNNANGDKEKLQELKYRVEKHLKTSTKHLSCTLFLLGSISKELKQYDLSIQFWKESFAIKKSRSTAVSLLSALSQLSSPDPLYSTLQQYLSFSEARFDFNAQDVTLEDINTAIYTNGFVILRNFFAPDFIKYTEQNFKDNVNHVKDTLKSISIEPEDCIYPSYFANKQSLNKYFSAKIKESFLNKNFCEGKYFSQEDYMQLEYFTNTLKSHSNLNTFIKKFIDKKHWSLYPSYSMGRVVSKKGYEKGGFAGFHQDSRIQNRFDQFITAWIPLSECGANIAPMICASPARFSQYYPFLREKKQNLSGNERVPQKSPYISYKDFPEECIYKPTLYPGDLWLHDPFTLHGTYADNTMKKTRYSLDLRFF